MLPFTGVENESLLAPQSSESVAPSQFRGRRALRDIMPCLMITMGYLDNRFTSGSLNNGSYEQDTFVGLHYRFESISIDLGLGYRYIVSIVTRI